MADRPSNVFDHNQFAALNQTIGSVTQAFSAAEFQSGLDEPLFDGSFHRRALTPGFEMMANDLVAVRSARQEATLPGQFVIRMPFQRSDIVLGKRPGNTFHLKPGSALTVAVSDDLELAGEFESGARYRDFFVRIEAGALLDDELAERVGEKMRRNTVDLFPTDHTLSARAVELCSPKTDGYLGGLLAESCALELVARSLGRSAGAVRSNSGITSRDRRKMEMVRDRLVAEPNHPHRLVDLAREVGVSVTTLKTKFQAVFDQSVAAYLRDVRLDLARQGIAHEGWTVSQAAYFVGYKHQSSFSAAFYKKFGMWPSQIGRS